MHFEIYPEPIQPRRLLAASTLLIEPSPTWRWRLVASNGEIIASGESYQHRQDCRHAIDLVMSTTVHTEVRQVKD